MADGLRPLPKLGGGMIDPFLAKALTQLQGTGPCSATVSPGVTAGSLAASLILSDASSPTLQLDHRVPGATTGAKTKIKATRNTTNADLFDLEVWFPNLEAVTPTVTATAATDIITATTFPSKPTGFGPVMFENSGGGLPTNISANTLYWLIAVASSSTSYKLATSKANALAATSVDIGSAGTGTHTIRQVIAELFKDVSMKPAHRRYVVNVVNLGADGNPASEFVRATNLSSATTENRPSNVGPSALAGGSASDFTMVGVHRRDHIVALVDLTSGAVWNADQAIAIEKDRVAIKSGPNITASDKLVALVAPRG